MLDQKASSIGRGFGVQRDCLLLLPIAKKCWNPSKKNPSLARRKRSGYFKLPVLSQDLRAFGVISLNAVSCP